jgi:hypothetical protein
MGTKFSKYKTNYINYIQYVYGMQRNRIAELLKLGNRMVQGYSEDICRENWKVEPRGGCHLT